MEIEVEAAAAAAVRLRVEGTSVMHLSHMVIKLNLSYFFLTGSFVCRSGLNLTRIQLDFFSSCFIYTEFRRVNFMFPRTVRVVAE